MSKASDSPSKLTAREYAAMTLKVPQSGVEWLDEMISSARELDAEQFKAKLKEPAKIKSQGPKDPPKGGAGTKVG